MIASTSGDLTMLMHLVIVHRYKNKRLHSSGPAIGNAYRALNKMIQNRSNSNNLKKSNSLRESIRACTTY